MRWGARKNAVRAGIGAVYPRLWRFCVSLAGDRAAGEDLAQATVLRALEQAAKFQPGTHLDRWLFVMARRLWLNELRHRAVRKGTGLRPVEELDLPDPAPGIETHIFASEVFDVVTALPEAQRVTALLVLVEGYSYAEAAEALDIPVGTVMSRIAAARRSVAARVGDAQEAGRKVR